MNSRLRTAMLAGILLAPMLGPAQAAPPTRHEAEVEGTVVSVRGDILVLRPNLRPVLTRVSVGPDAVVLTQDSVGVDRLRPGMRIQVGAQMTGGAMHVRRLTASAGRIGPLAEKSHGLEIDKSRGRAYGLGTLVSVRPFTFTDDAGHRYTATLEALHDVSLYRTAGRRDLLIGVSLNAQGTVSPDGVIRAKTVSVDNQFARKGTMFGAIVGVRGTTLQVRPRFSTDVLQVSVSAGCTWQRQTSLDPDGLPVGSAVTFWGQPGPTPGTLEALALLVGGQRYPAADAGQHQVFLSGRLAGLDPVTLALPGGRRVRVIIPAQMPIARLATVSADDVTPGESAMLVLSRLPDGHFQTSAVVLDASPWAGYGG